jgi:hypothetical protein
VVLSTLCCEVGDRDISGREVKGEPIGREGLKSNIDPLNVRVPSEPS